MKSNFCFGSLGLLVGLMILPAQSANSQAIPHYYVNRATSPIVIDGSLNEAAWASASLTAPFTLYGRTPHLCTQAKMLYDDSCLYVGFICDDSDVWTTYTQRDGPLDKNDVVEVLCDPDGDGLNYFEIEVNPLNVVADLTWNKPSSEGGVGNWGWNLSGFRSAVSVDGTVNVLDTLDWTWLCEMAIPFKGISFLAPTASFPPKSGEAWRIQLTRQDYLRTGTMEAEATSWSPTDSVHGFHVPSEFGYLSIMFDPSSVKPHTDETVPGTPMLLDNYPNPFNPKTGIRVQASGDRDVRLVVYDLLGREVAVLANGRYPAGKYEFTFDGGDLSSGVYFYRMTAGNYSAVRKMSLLR